MLRRDFLVGLASTTAILPNSKSSPDKVGDALDDLKKALEGDPTIGKFEVHYSPHSRAVIVVTAFRKLSSPSEQDGHNV